MPTLAHVALGSNLGDRAAYIHAAAGRLGALPATTPRALSPIIETDPVGPQGQGPYLNAAAELSTTLNPAELIAGLLSIERDLGRDRAVTQRWGPRTIDLDLLLYGDAVIDAERLTVPHPRMHQRAFVLVPLSQIAPHALHPVFDRSVIALLNALSAS